jgi:hypothetical protein
MPPNSAPVRQRTRDGRVIQSLLGRELCIDEFQTPEAEAEVRATHAAIHQKANALMPHEQTRFNLADSRFHQIAEFLSLAFGDRSLQVMDAMSALYIHRASCP